MRMRHFHGNFGFLQLAVDNDGNVHGTYGDDGTFRGRLHQGVYACTWKNGEEEGRLEFEISAGELTGRWKRGTEAGAMRGKWAGSEVEQEEGWHILHDIGTFYLFFGNLAKEAAQAAEIAFVNQEIRKWNLTIGERTYSFNALKAKEADAYFDVIYNALYCDDSGEPNKSPLEQLNASHAHLCDFFNEGVLDGGNIRTLMFSLFQLCEIDGFTDAQLQQLGWYVEQWQTACPEVESAARLIQLVRARKDLKNALGDVGELPWEGSQFMNDDQRPQ